MSGCPGITAAGVAHLRGIHAVFMDLCHHSAIAAAYALGMAVFIL